MGDKPEGLMKTVKGLCVLVAKDAVRLGGESKVSDGFLLSFLPRRVKII